MDTDQYNDRYNDTDPILIFFFFVWQSYASVLKRPHVYICLFFFSLPEYSSHAVIHAVTMRYKHMLTQRPNFLHNSQKHGEDYRIHKWKK